MKIILRIARMELQKMFYSPIAWFILVIFGIQSGITFMKRLGHVVMNLGLGTDFSDSITYFIYSFNSQLDNLYLYIPLITMGLMSKEFGSGSIKLLYSSPVSNRQIVLGKFLSMMVFGLAMVLIIFLACLYGFWGIKDYDLPMVLTGLLGLYLVICTYSAIGLFMSSLTSYQVVAAIGSFTAFFVLQSVSRMWQDVEFVRDITFWLSMSGRASSFIQGLICSEDLLYFIFVSGLFISFTIFRLKGMREKSPWYISFTRYAAAFVLVVLLGYVSTIPSLMKYHDSTHTKVNTITENSQEIISKLEGEVTITTYANPFAPHSTWAFPKMVNWDMGRYEQYRRFKPDLKMKYKYYYGLPVQKNLLRNHNRRFAGMSIEDALAKVCEAYRIDENMFKPGADYLYEIDLTSELNRFVRKIETEDGKVSYLRIYDDQNVFPYESQKTAAFKNLVMELPLVGFVAGHNERDMDDFGSRGYYALTKEKPFRWSLTNNGFDFTECVLSAPVDKRIGILVIAEAKTVFSKQEMKNLNDYIDRGGNLVIAADRKRQKAMNPLVERFGVKFMEGQVVEYNEGYTQDMVTGTFTPAGQEISYYFGEVVKAEACVTMKGAVGISYKDTGDFKATPVLLSDTIKNMPGANDPEFLKQLKKAQEAEKEGPQENKPNNTSPVLMNLHKRLSGNIDKKNKKNYAGSWNELQTKNFLDDVAVFNPEQGEVGGAITMALALERNVGGKDQKIMILGDADCFSNGEVMSRRKEIKAQNFMMAMGTFFWLSDGEVPIDVRRPTPPDIEIYTENSDMPFLKALYKIIIPALLALSFLLIWLRRRGR